MVGAILQSIGGLGLFLLGMSLLTDGLKALAGSSLKVILRSWTRNPFTGALGGAVVTAVIQSSSATTITVIGLVGAGVMTFPNAIGVILGANIGTTATGWLVAIFGFKVPLATIAMPLILVGALGRMLGRQRLRSVGLGIAGFAVIFVGIDVMQAGMAALEGVVSPESFPGDDLLGRLQLVGIGVAITVITQSSSAGLVTALAAVHSGTIGFSQAAAMVIGMNVGTTVTAVLATLGGRAAARRTGYAHVIFNLLTGVIAFALLGPFIDVASLLALDDNPELFLVGFHTFFNLLGVVLFLPITGSFAKLVMKLVPSNEPVLTRHLEPKLLDAPTVALEAVEATIREIAALTLGMLLPVFRRQAQSALDSAIVPLEQAIQETHDYVERVSRRSDGSQLHERAVHLLYAADHLDRIVVRLGRSRRIDTIIATPELSSLCSELDALITRIDPWVRSGGREGRVRIDDAESIWKRLEEHNQTYRKQVMGQAAAGRISVTESMRRLDAMRWLVRVAHHLWRLSFHLAAIWGQERAEVGGPREHEADA